VPTPTPLNLFCLSVLWLCTRKTIKDKKRSMMVSPFWDKELHREFPYVVSMHMCITTPLGSSLPVLFTPP
jgi:hypothetical protein